MLGNNAVVKNRELPQLEQLTQLPLSGQRSCCCKVSVRNGGPKATDMGLSLLGALVWLALPKCPLCLAAYLAIGSGLSLTVAQSRTLYIALAFLAAGLFAWGASRMLLAFWRRGRLAIRLNAE